MRLELAKVSKRYGQVRALHDVTLAVPSGARVALIGPNGSGKTTLTRVILGVVAHEGELRFDGAPVAGQRAQLAQRVAYVPQVAPQLAASVGELIGGVARLRGLAVAEIDAMAVALALAPDELRARAFRGLSGGMKQKLLLALAFAAHASLLVLDEPTASLDAAARTRFYELYERHTPGSTVLLCSHRLEEIQHMVDHVIALEDGRVTYQGPARAYLDARTFTLLALRLDGSAEAAAWARAHDFAPGAAGWWTRAITPAQKLPLLTQAIGGLGARLQDVSVRDLETVAAGDDGKAVPRAA